MLSNDTTPTTERRIQRVRHELRIREVTVSRVVRPTPGFAAITFSGPALAGFTSLSFDDHVKLILPGADGEPVRRDYTPRHFDFHPSRPALTLEFALHGHGAASAWARQAAPGQTVSIGGPRGSMVVPVDYDWHLLAGDATALPAIARRLEELPEGARALVLLEVADAADERGLATRAHAQVHWVRSSQAWLQALRGMTLPEGEGFAWCAGEARTMAQAREILLQDHGHPKEAARIAAYWKAGAQAFHEPL